MQPLKRFSERFNLFYRNTPDYVAILQVLENNPTEFFSRTELEELCKLEQYFNIEYWGNRKKARADYWGSFDLVCVEDKQFIEKRFSIDDRGLYCVVYRIVEGL